MSRYCCEKKRWWSGADIAKNPRGARFQMGHTYHTILFKAPEAHLENFEFVDLEKMVIQISIGRARISKYMDIFQAS